VLSQLLHVNIKLNLIVWQVRHFYYAFQERRKVVWEDFVVREKRFQALGNSGLEGSEAFFLGYGFLVRGVVEPQNFRGRTILKILFVLGFCDVQLNDTVALALFVEHFPPFILRRDINFVALGVHVLNSKFKVVIWCIEFLHLSNKVFKCRSRR